MTAANRPAVNYAYDTAGRLSTISQGSETFTYSYDAISRLAGLQRPNGVSTGYEYDNANRLSRLSHKNSVNQFIEDLKYTYNPDSEIESINSLANAPNLPAAKTVDPADAANRIHQFGSTLNQFNAEGETTSQTTQQGTVNYTWDARGRMTQAALPGGQTVSYNYDALGRRAGRSSGGASTGFLYDGDDVVLDSNSDGSTVDYLNGQSIDDKLRQASSTTGTNYFLQDHLGSTVALTDPSGNLSARINYEPFGESPGSALTRYDYTGRERDSATGLLYYRARWMDPKQGRFLTEDPIGFRGENNFYSYVGDNALNYKDPHGLFIFVPYLINIGRGAIVGGLVSAAASIALGERDYRKVLASGLSGAVSGGLNSAGLGPGASAAIGSALNEYLNEKIDCQKLNPNKILLSAVLGGGTGKALDKVKIIGSSSSGKIGAAVGATANDFSKEVASQIVDTIVKAPLFPESPPEHR
jgi:RHS repeat-associated protein